MYGRILIVGLSLLLMSPAWAEQQVDFAQLYKAKNYQQICKSFEADKANNWKHADHAYFYALALICNGRQFDGVHVCHEIVQKFPKTSEAGLAKTAIKLWTPAKKLATASQKVSNGTGIVGMRFIYEAGQWPRIARVFAGTPAAESGLKINDQIAAVDGTSTNALSKDEIYQMIIGKPDTYLTITIMRNDVQSDVHIRRMNLEQMRVLDPVAYQDYLMSK